MSEASHKSHRRQYITVFVALALLTLLELAIPDMKNMSHASKASALVGLAVGKAFLVAYFFMHLKEEKAWLKIIASIPITAAFYAVVLMLEAIYR